MEEIEELKKQVKELNKKIEELENKEKSKRWKAEEGGTYYHINDIGIVCSAVEELSETDSFRYRIRNYFKTGEEAEEYLERINIYYELMDLAEELNGGEKINWENTNQHKHYIYIDDSEDSDLFCGDTCYYKDIGQIYCLDENFLEKAKERIGEGRLKKLFV